MIAPDLETAILRLRDLIEGAAAIVPFTGAGISTECGIPDFRSPGGLWTKNQPIPFDAFMASGEMRDEAWRRRFVMEESFAKAKPGRGHLALASLYRAGKVPALVTQNIDNLHQASGIAPDDVVELHGNTTYAVCLECDQRYELSWVLPKIREPMATRAGLRSPVSWPGTLLQAWPLLLGMWGHFGLAVPLHVWHKLFLRVPSPPPGHENTGGERRP